MYTICPSCGKKTAVTRVVEKQIRGNPYHMRCSNCGFLVENVTEDPEPRKAATGKLAG